MSYAPKAKLGFLQVTGHRHPGSFRWAGGMLGHAEGVVLPKNLEHTAPPAVPFCIANFWDMDQSIWVDPLYFGPK